MSGITRESIEDELYAAIEAVEKGDLVRARGCVARANADIIEMWQSGRRNEQESVTRKQEK